MKRTIAISFDQASLVDLEVLARKVLREPMERNDSPPDKSELVVYSVLPVIVLLSS